MVFEGLGQVIWVFYLTVISKDTFYFMYFALAINIVTAVCCYWVPESPRYLYGINELEKCKEVFTYIAAKNGIQDYQAPQFQVDYEIMIENVDGEGTITSRPSNEGQAPTHPKTEENSKLVGGNDNSNFDSLISQRDRTTAAKANADTEENRDTTTIGRYMTVNKDYLKSRDPTATDNNQLRATRLTKRETVSFMHATVTGVRQTGALWMIGVDRTQSIAIDEIFSTKPINEDGAVRKTVTLRNTTNRVSRATKID